jgi:LysM repeat protein
MKETAVRETTVRETTVFGGFTAAEIVAGTALSLLLPLLVYAGGFFNTTDDATRKVKLPENVQRASALQSEYGTGPDSAIGGGGVTVVDNEALAASGGPTDTRPGNPEVKRSAGEISLYVVRDGDTLSQISQMFEVSVNTIIWANEQVDSKKDISPGDTLVILPISGVRHTVKEGETLENIVEEYNGNRKEVRNFNNLKEGETLAIGDTITIPNGEMTHSHSADRSDHSADGSDKAQNSSSAGRKRAQSQPRYTGYYRRPIEGGVRTQGHHGYDAIDIGAAHGTPILAAADGTVIVEKGQGYNGGYGRYVVIRHDNGTQTLYAHNSQNNVSVGQQVVKGQVIGYLGSTGRSTGPHVHFEVRGARNPF